MAIRVLHVVTYMGRGGLETMLMNYYRHIDRNKIQFDFLVHRDFEADYDQEIKELGGNIYYVPPLNPFSLKYHQAIDRFFANHRYDIVHSHLDCLSAYPLKYVKKYGTKIRIAHAHNKNQEKNLKYIIKLVSKHWMPYYATHLFACSEEAGTWMFSGYPFTIMRNAISAKDFVYSPEQELEMRKKLGLDNKFVIGHVGRFHPQKNHEFLIKIFHSLCSMESDVQLLLVGSGDKENEIRALVKKFGIDEKVTFLGSRSDIPALLQMMDVFVFPSLYEGLGIAAVEAQAAGVPCILSDQIPEECKMCDNVEFVSLDEPAEKWAKKIHAHRNDRKTNNYELIKKEGYDIVSNVTWLEEFYLSGGSRDE